MLIVPLGTANVNKVGQATFVFSDARTASVTYTVNGTQVVLAVLLYRIAENHRRRPVEADPQLVRYASCFIAMRMGQRLLHDFGKKLDEINHQCFEEARSLIETRGEAYFRAAVQDIESALNELYGQKEVSTLQLSATFRRGDLIQKLLALPVGNP